MGNEKSKQMGPYEMGRSRGMETINATATDINDKLIDEDSISNFLKYLWGIRDAYNDALRQALPKLVPIDMPDDKDQAHSLWNISSTIDQYINSIADSKDRPEKVEHLVRDIVRVIVTLTGNFMGDKLRQEIMHSIRDQVDILTNESAKKDGKNGTQ